MKKIIALALAAVMMLTLFCSCGGKDSGSASSGEASTVSKLDAIKASGELVMYTNAEFPPYEFVDGTNADAVDDVVGVDVEIGKAIAEKIGVKLVVKQTNFDGIIAGLASGKGDIVVSGVTINAERKDQVDFSVPYVDSVQYLIVPEDSAIATMEDLAGKKVGAQTGTTGETLVSGENEEGVLKDNNAIIVQHTSAPNAMADLKKGTIDAVVIDELVAKSIAEQNDGYKAISFKFASGDLVTEQFGVAVAKGNPELLAVVNEVVGKLVNDGKIEEYIAKYEALTAE